MTTDRDQRALLVATADRGARPPRPAARRGGSLRLTWVAVSAFLVLLALLALQMAAGRDPALRARAAAATPPPRRVLVRRVIERRVIVHLPPSAPPQSSSSSQQLSAGAIPFSTVATRTS